MTRALPTGLAAFVTFPRTCRTVGSGGTSGFAGFATAIKVNATANRRTRRINLLKPTPAQPRIVLLIALSATHRSVTAEPVAASGKCKLSFGLAARHLPLPLRKLVEPDERAEDSSSPAGRSASPSGSRDG